MGYIMGLCDIIISSISIIIKRLKTSVYSNGQTGQYPLQVSHPMATYVQYMCLIVLPSLSLNVLKG